MTLIFIRFFCLDFLFNNVVFLCLHEWVHEFTSQELGRQFCYTWEIPSCQLEGIESRSAEHQVCSERSASNQYVNVCACFFFRKFLKNAFKTAITSFHPSIFVWTSCWSFIHFNSLSLEIFFKKWLAEFGVCVEVWRRSVSAYPFSLKSCHHNFGASWF